MWGGFNLLGHNILLGKHLHCKSAPAAGPLAPFPRGAREGYFRCHGVDRGRRGIYFY